MAYARWNGRLEKTVEPSESRRRGWCHTRRGPLLRTDSRSLRWARLPFAGALRMRANRNRHESHREPAARSRDVSAERRGLRALLVAGGIAVLLAGCAAGQVTSTAEIVPVVDGALATVNTMDLGPLRLRRRRTGAGPKAPLLRCGCF